MPGGLVIINQSNFDIGDLGAFVSVPVDWRDTTQQSRGLVVPTGAHVAIITAPTPKVRERRLRFSIGMTAADLATLLSNQLKLKARLTRGEVQLSFSDASSKAFFCYRGQIRRVGGHGPELVQTAQLLDCEFEVPVPYLQTVTPESVSLTTAFADLPAGTGPIYPVITINGAATPVVDPVITIEDSSAVELGTFTLTASLGAGETRVVDMLNETVKDESGVSQYADFTAGKFLRVLPEDFVYETSSWARAKLTATSGTPTGDAVFRKWDD